MLDKLWGLIMDEDSAVSGYYEFLDGDFAKSAKGAPFVKVIKQIIADEQDHANALRVLYGEVSKIKPVTDATEVAKRALSDYKESQKLIR